MTDSIHVNPTEKGKLGVSRGRKARGLATREIAQPPVNTYEVSHIMRFLFRSKAIRVIAVLGALAALPVASVSADTTSIYATAQGTSVLGIPVPVLGTRGWTVTVPVDSHVAPQFAWGLLDFTVTSRVTVGSTEVCFLYIDPRMV